VDLAALVDRYFAPGKAALLSVLGQIEIQFRARATRSVRVQQRVQYRRFPQLRTQGRCGRRKELVA
jgi:hypothetical protein